VLLRLERGGPLQPATRQFQPIKAQQVCLPEITPANAAWGETTDDEPQRSRLFRRKRAAQNCVVHGRADDSSFELGRVGGDRSLTRAHILDALESLGELSALSRLRWSTLPAKQRAEHTGQDRVIAQDDAERGLQCLGIGVAITTYLQPKKRS
jgi:hypothetical protein